MSSRVKHGSVAPAPFVRVPSVVPSVVPVPVPVHVHGHGHEHEHGHE